jgi:hypothetical protein
MGIVVACRDPFYSLAAIKGSKFESYHVQKSKSLQHHQVTLKIPNIFLKREKTATYRENPGLLGIRILPTGR